MERKNQHNLFVTLGASSHSSTERQQDDYYATDPIAMELLLDLEQFSPNIWECACGAGHLSKVLEAHGYHVKSTDLVYRGCGAGGGRFPIFRRSFRRRYHHQSSVQICQAVC